MTTNAWTQPMNGAVLDRDDTSDIAIPAGQRTNVPNRYQNPTKARIRLINSNGGYYDLSIPTFEGTSENLALSREIARKVKQLVSPEQFGGYVELKPGETLKSDGTVGPMEQGRTRADFVRSRRQS